MGLGLEVLVYLKGLHWAWMSNFDVDTKNTNIAERSHGVAKQAHRGRSISLAAHSTQATRRLNDICS